MAIIINREQTEFKKNYGFQYVEGFVEAYEDTNGTKGVVNTETNEFFPTVPLNGWRARCLAEEVFGIRKADEMHIGRIFVTTAKTLQELPGFDGDNQEIVDSYRDSVAVQVVKHDPSYGVHIRIMQM